VVLKATHFPFVAAIWAYENSRQFILPVSSATVPKSPGRPLSACQAGPGRVRAANRPTPLAPNTDPTRETHTLNLFNATSAAPAASTATLADLVGLVQQLSSQVEELTSIVAGEQKD
jgi:hypothetical protein